MAEKKSKGMTIDKVRAIDHQEIPYPEGGGIVIFKGPNGAGKSTGLAAMELHVLGTKTDLEPSDGAERGIMKGFGVTTTVMKTVKRTGKPDTMAISGTLNVGAFIEPPVKDPKAADKARFKILASMFALTASPVEFSRELGVPEEMIESFAEDVFPDSPDLVEMAAFGKKRLQQLAREAEGAADRKLGEFRSLTETGASAGEVADDATLQKAYEDAVEVQGKVNAAAKVKAQLEALSEEKGDAQQLDREVSFMDQEIKELEEQLRSLRDQRKALSDRLDRVQERDRLSANITEGLPTADEAAAAVTRARKAIEDNGRAKTAADARQGAEAAKEAADEALRDAQRMRDLCDKVDPAVSTLVGRKVPWFKIQDDRLMTDHARGLLPYSDLSMGERSRLIMDVAVEAGGPGCMVFLDQSFWEGLDDNNRRDLWDNAKATGVVIYTAEQDASRDHLWVEIYDGKPKTKAA